MSDEPLAIYAAEFVDVAQRKEFPFARHPLVPGNRCGHTRCSVSGDLERGMTELMMRSAEHRLPRRDPPANVVATQDTPASTRAVVRAGIDRERCRNAVDVVCVEPVAVASHQFEDGDTVVQGCDVEGRHLDEDSRRETDYCLGCAGRAMGGWG